MIQKEKLHSKVAKKRKTKKRDEVKESSIDKPKTLEVNSSNVVPIKGGLPVEVLGPDSTYANKMHIKVVDLMHKYEETYFKLAEALYEVRSKKLYRLINGKYNTFEQYVEGLGVEYRKARYLVRLWWWYGVEQNRNPKLLEGAQKIGWSKAAELIEVVDGRNASRWFKLANEMNRKDLAQAARIARKSAEKKKTKLESKGKKQKEKNEPDEFPKDMDVANPKLPKVAKPFVPDSISESLEEPFDDVSEGIDPPEGLEAKVEAQKEQGKDWHRYMFDIHRDSWDIVRDAFQYAGELGESSHRGHLLSLICLHYVSFYDKHKSVMIGEWLSVLERLTGLSIVAIDKKTKEIVFGVDLINELASVESEDSDVC